jgi:hypothetical protein
LPLAATSLLAQRTMSSSVISPLHPTQSHIPQYPHQLP